MPKSIDSNLSGETAPGDAEGHSTSLGAQPTTQPSEAAANGGGGAGGAAGGGGGGGVGVGLADLGGILAGGNGDGGVGGGGSVASGCGGKKYRHQRYSKNIYIGTKNAEKWDLTRNKHSFKNDVEFVCYLLKLADRDFGLDASQPGDSLLAQHREASLTEQLLKKIPFRKLSTEHNERLTPGRKKGKRVQFHESVQSDGGSRSDTNRRDHFASLRKNEQHTLYTALSQNSQDAQDNSVTSTIGALSNTANGGLVVPDVLDCRIAEKIKIELERKLHDVAKNGDLIADAFGLPRPITQGLIDEIPKRRRQKRKLRSRDNSSDDLTARGEFDVKKSHRSQSKMRRRTRYREGGSDNDEGGDLHSDYMDFDRDGDFEFNNEEVDDEDDDDDDEFNEDDEEEEIVELQDKHIPELVELDPSKSHLCIMCQEDHVLQHCPVRNANATIADSMTHAQWLELHDKELARPIKKEDEESEEGEENYFRDYVSKLKTLEGSYAMKSLPPNFVYENARVFTNRAIDKYTRFGPLIGNIVLPANIPEDSRMAGIIEMFDGEFSTFVSVENRDTSNWLGLVRPSNSLESRNAALVVENGRLFMVTTQDLDEGCELTYWSDDCNSAWAKRKIDKMSCGGCNLKFEHPLHYRTHCSAFHDPDLSLTIRKYYCKICSGAFIGKDNIMKHAIEQHDGKGAYQCQFCNKFFLRLNYLEMHRTYGCSANPQRAKPLCDFCGRKFCQPQKLKMHIKRMHSDMADVLREFQCKLCSKLLGSRAALQRHSKEVHSRNTAVVSCPRCQKLFQNRSNLKIHMLTHSGVRPFKCMEGECNAAFTTKQCLQFHYKKVHNFTPEQMPKIERSIAYTFDAYSGGMKVEYLEDDVLDPPRRRRRSLETSSMRSLGMPTNGPLLDPSTRSIQHSDFFGGDKSILDKFKKSEATFSSLCKNEPNLSMLTSKISSILEQGILKQRKSKAAGIAAPRKACNMEELMQQPMMQHPQTQQPNDFGGGGVDQHALMGMSRNPDDYLQSLHQKRHQQNKQLSLIETFLSTATSRSTEDDDNEDEDDEDDDDEQDLAKAAEYKKAQLHNFAANLHRSDVGQSSVPNIIPSKGSRKWISNAADSGHPTDDDLVSKLTQPNRDFISRLIMNNGVASTGASKHQDHQDDDDDDDEEEDENSSFLEVVEPNQQQQQHQHHQQQQHQHQEQLQNQQQQQQQNYTNAPLASNAMQNLPHHIMGSHLNTQTPFMGTFYNHHSSNNATGNPRNGTSSTSASMLVEAALSSVSGMLGVEDVLSEATKQIHDNGSSMDGNVDLPLGQQIQNQPMKRTESEISLNPSSESSGQERFTANENAMKSIEEELKLIKSINNFQTPSISQFGESSQTTMNGDDSPHNEPRSLSINGDNNGDIDVDSGSTPRNQVASTVPLEANDKIYSDNPDSFNEPQQPQHISPRTTTPHAAVLSSPGKDYGSAMYSNGGATMASPHSQVSRRNYHTSDHDMNSPASSPALPRYGSFRRDSGRKGDHDHGSSGQNNQNPVPAGLPHQQQHPGTMSSDEENSIMAQNLSMGSGHNTNNSNNQNNNGGTDEMRAKFAAHQQSPALPAAAHPTIALGGQMDMMYKYPADNNEMNEVRNKYLDQQQQLEIGFRGVGHSSASANNDHSASVIADMQQGLDMTASRSNFHHNFPNGLSRYHHHIYDILSEREQLQQQQQQQQQHQHQQHQHQHQDHHSQSQHQQQQQHQHQQHSHQQQQHLQHQHHSQPQQPHQHLQLHQQHQHMQHLLQHDPMNPDADTDQTTSVDLSRSSANASFASPPPAYPHSHADLLRMSSSLDLVANGGGGSGPSGMMGSAAASQRSFMSPQLQHNGGRDPLDHHRFLAAANLGGPSDHQLSSSHRLLVDPTSAHHLLMEQNNRLLAGSAAVDVNAATNRHLVSSRGFGAYHHQAAAAANYHHSVRPLTPSPNHHSVNPSSGYHPFPSYYQ